MYACCYGQAGRRRHKQTGQLGRRRGSFMYAVCCGHRRKSSALLPAWLLKCLGSIYYPTWVPLKLPAFTQKTTAVQRGKNLNSELLITDRKNQPGEEQERLRRQQGGTWLGPMRRHQCGSTAALARREKRKQ